MFSSYAAENRTNAVTASRHYSSVSRANLTMMKTILSALVVGTFLVSGVAFAAKGDNPNAPGDKAKGRYTEEVQQQSFQAKGDNPNAPGDKAKGR